MAHAGSRARFAARCAERRALLGAYDPARIDDARRRTASGTRSAAPRLALGISAASTACDSRRGMRATVARPLEDAAFTGRSVAAACDRAVGVAYAAALRCGAGLAGHSHPSARQLSAECAAVLVGRLWRRRPPPSKRLRDVVTVHDHGAHRRPWRVADARARALVSRVYGT